MRARLGPRLTPGDLVIISEKVAVITSGHALPATQVVVTPLARRLAAGVRPTKGSRGLSLPEKMQLVIDQTGKAPDVLAAAVGACARRLGVRGAFANLQKLVGDPTPLVGRLDPLLTRGRWPAVARPRSRGTIAG
ncbi:MAG: hypothetical protein ACR2MA_05930 [Egibacteraceae bacterium]